jgi:hypothetical protein
MDVKGLVRYTPWETNIAIENAPVEIVDLPFLKMVALSIVT